jgi:hypothetical protein
VTVVALASIAAGAIHVSAATTLGRGNTQTYMFFAMVAAAQVVWGLIALMSAPRWWLILGVLGNAVVLTTWIVSRTVGLPFGEFAHEVLPVEYPDVLVAIFEAVVIVGAATLAIRGSVPARAVTAVRGFALAAAIALGLLALSGIMSQANAFSGGSGSGQNSGPTAPNGGAYGGYGGTGGAGGYGGSSGTTTGNGGY